MDRASRGAGWRRARVRAQAEDGLRVLAADREPMAPRAIVDEALVARFRAALFDHRAHLHRSIRILPVDTEPDGHWFASYVALVDAIGWPDESVAAWWRPNAGDVAAIVGPPSTEAPVVWNTDLDLAVWHLTRDMLVDVIHRAGELPTLLATPEPGWVLIAPPASDDLFLYPEVSASDR